MKFSEGWLREWVDPGISTGELVHRLTMAGLEVDSASPVAPEFSGVMVAEVRTVDAHPQADRLRVCTVDAGGGDDLSIVCGASNVRPGLRVPLARVGAVLPGGKKITKAKLRGVESHGMLCSAVELGIAEEAAGLLELPGDAPLGEDVRRYLVLDDVSIEVDLTPNRGDCLGVAGVAREVGVLTRTAVTGPDMEPVPPAIEDTFPVEIHAQRACPRYAGRVVRGIDPAAPTPLWMRERLRRSGIRPISAVVDVTNYVLLELGQPMHAFDLDKLHGGIRVRYASEGESLTLLDGQTVTLDEQTLVIADHERSVALAGIMGGAETGCSDATRNVFLESAFFAPAEMAGRARRYKLQTDSSYRFERGVDFELQVRALERATALLTGICGGEPGPVQDYCSAAHLPARQTLLLRAQRLQRVIGHAYAYASVVDILLRLGMQVRPAESGWEVSAPSFRFDVAIEADLIEEIARVAGYEQIESRTHRGAASMVRQPETGIGVQRLRQALVDRGYQEAITYSFVDPALQKRLHGGDGGIALENPIASDLAVMRQSLWPSLLGALLHNLKRQRERVRLFETGLVFNPAEEGNVQNRVIGGIAAGPALPEQWAAPATAIDFYDIKGDVDALLELGGASRLEFAPVEHPALHPGQAAALLDGRRTCGRVGALHPAIARELDLPYPVYLFEIELAAVARRTVPCFRPLSRFPTVRRDLSILVDSAVPAASVTGCVLQNRPQELRDLQLFDLYEGEGIDSGKKSIALGLIFQGSSSTLIDEEVDSLIEGILARLAKDLGATLRD